MYPLSTTFFSDISATFSKIPAKDKMPTARLSATENIQSSNRKLMNLNIQTFYFILLAIILEELPDASALTQNCISTAQHKNIQKE